MGGWVESPKRPRLGAMSKICRRGDGHLKEVVASNGLEARSAGRQYAERVDETKVKAANTKTSKPPLYGDVHDKDKVTEEPDAWKQARPALEPSGGGDPGA